MAREVIVRMTDDLDRSKLADITRDLTFEGVVYTLDLTSEHYEELKADLQPWMDAAHEKTRLGAGKRPATASTPARPAKVGGVDKAAREERAKIRRWAQESGYPLGAKGIIAGYIIEAYYAAQQGTVTVEGGGGNGDHPPAPPVEAPVEKPPTTRSEGKRRATTKRAG